MQMLGFLPQSRTLRLVGRVVFLLRVLIDDENRIYEDVDWTLVVLDREFAFQSFLQRRLV